MRQRLGVLLGCCLLGAASAWAREVQTYPAEGSQVFLGLDDTSAPTKVEDGRAQDLQNVTLSVSKDLRTRFGYKRIGTTQDIALEDNCAVTGLYYTKFSSGTERIVSTCGTRFNYLNGSAWTTVSGVTVSQTAGANNQFVWTTALDEIIGTNNVNPPIRYNGTTLTTVDFTTLSAANRPTTVKTLAFFKNFLIVANTTENGTKYPTRFRWSNVGTTGTWSNVDFVDIGALGGQEITALAELYDNLYVFLTDSIYRISFVAGADTFQVSKVTDDIGCIAKNSVQSITLTNAQNGLIFLDKDKKVYFFDGVSVRDISPLITQTMGSLSASRLQYAVSADSNTDYFLCLTTGTGSDNNLCLDFQYQIGEWTKQTNIPANAMAHVLDNNSKDQVYVGSPLSFVYQLNDSSLIEDVGSAFGTVNIIDRYTTSTASSLVILYTTSANYTTGAIIGALAGAPIVLTDTAGVQLTNTVADNTATGLVMASTFTSAPVVRTTFEVGAIDAFYTTKWYDVGQAARLKHFGEVYFWADSGTASGLTVTYANDFNANVSSQNISLASTATDAVWGSAVWGTSLWGTSTEVFRQVKVDGTGRYFKVKFAEDDPHEDFNLFGWSLIFWAGDIN